MGDSSLTMNWVIVSSTVIGSRHEADETPCQDCHICQAIETEYGEFLIAAASDGAGSAPQSHLGATLACSGFVEVTRSAVTLGGMASLTTDFLAEWIVSHQEKVSRLAAAEDLKPRDYAHTFLGAVIGEGKACYVQIGDGAIVIPTASVSFETVFWPQRGEYANETYFLTDTQATKRILFEVHDSAPDALAIFTDGLQHMVLDYRQQIPHGPFFDSYLSWVRGGDFGQDFRKSAQLSEFLASPEVNQKTDDDKTLILAALKQSLPTT
jgi:Protein phosphatase 2C